MDRDQRWDRTEKAYRHWGHDMGYTDTPLETGLAFTCKFNKPNGFIGSDEFQTIYGENSSNEAFLTGIYNNVLNRGPDGDGFDWVTGVSFNIPGTMTSLSRDSYEAIVSASSHDGDIHWTPLSDEEKKNLISRIYSFSGVPGYYLDNVTGDYPDVQCVSNVQLAKIKSPRDGVNYEIILTRPLITNDAQDVQFDLITSMVYDFSLYLTDNDDLNKIGTENESLTFLPKR